MTIPPGWWPFGQEQDTRPLTGPGLTCAWHAQRGIDAIPAVGSFLSACTHEHVRLVAACADCFAQALSLADCGELYCLRCLAGRLSHRCPVQVTDLREITGNLL